MFQQLMCNSYFLMKINAAYERQPVTID
jgi:hypothetical protein